MAEPKPTIALAFGGGHVANWQAGALGAYNAARESGYDVIAFAKGYEGANLGRYYVVNEGQIFPDRAGIYFGASRAKVDPEAVRAQLINIRDRDGYDVKGVIGFVGDDHLKQTWSLQAQGVVPVVGWPKTMDNDLSYTYCTLGYHTAGTNAIGAVRRGIDCAVTNGRIHVITMFGRNTDWIVAAAGGFGGANITIGGELGSSSIYTAKYQLKNIIDMAKKAAEQNEARYGINFAVLAMAESAAVEGLQSHIDIESVDAHGNPKIEPELLALGVKKAFAAAGVKNVSTDTLTYDTLRNCPPTAFDRELGKEAGSLCARLLVGGTDGVSVVLERDDSAPHKVKLSHKPIQEVAKTRRLRPEGFMDYDGLRVTSAFIDYYRPIFGDPTTIEDRLPELQLRTA